MLRDIPISFESDADYTLFVSRGIILKMFLKITLCNNFYVPFLVLFVEMRYIELHHFNFVILLSFNILSYLQNLYVPNIALVNILNDIHHLVVLLGKSKLITNAS